MVLNHISFDNDVISQHPDSAFNPLNTPQLIPAIEVDLVIQRISEELEEEQFAITSEVEVNRVVARIQDRLQNTLHLEEYWLIDPQRIFMALSHKFQLLSFSHQDFNDCSDKELTYAFSQCLFEDQVGYRFPISLDAGIAFLFPEP